MLHRTVITPAFGVTTTWPRHANTNATSEPEIKLVFNADVRAEEAQPFLYFRDGGWQRIPADVRQGTMEEAGYELGGTSSLRTWAQQFDRTRSSGPSGSGSAGGEDSDEPGRQPAHRDAPLGVAAGQRLETGRRGRASDAGPLLAVARGGGGARGRRDSFRGDGRDRRKLHQLRGVNPVLVLQAGAGVGDE